MSEVQEFYGIRIGDHVRAKIGPYKGWVIRVVSIDTAGARNGWFTCMLGDDPKDLGLYAGEELELVRNTASF